MKKTTMVLAAAGIIASCSGAFAQDAPGNMMVSVAPGLNLQIGASVKDDLLAGTEKFGQGASKVTEINLNPSTMDMAGRNYGPGGDMNKKMKLMVVHTYGYDKPGMYRMEDVETYAKKLQDGSWSCPVVSREKYKDQEKLSYICTKTGTDQTNEMVVLTAEPQKLTFIHMAGTMSLNDLTRMSDNAHGLTRSVEPHGNFYVGNPQTVRLPTFPGKVVITTPGTAGVPAAPVVPAPPAPPAQ